MTKKKNGDAIVDSSQAKAGRVNPVTTPSMSTSLCLWMCRIAKELNQELNLLSLVVLHRGVFSLFINTKAPFSSAC